MSFLVRKLVFSVLCLVSLLNLNIGFASVVCNDEKTPASAQTVNEASTHEDSHCASESEECSTTEPCDCSDCGRCASAPAVAVLPVGSATPAVFSVGMESSFRQSSLVSICLAPHIRPPSRV